MRSNSNANLTLFVSFLSLAFLLASCATGPAPPAQGTPAWHWRNAQTTWEAGDLRKTSDNLETLIAAGGEFAERAQPWRLILTGGMAAGFMDLAEGFELGARANPAASAGFRKYMSDYRSMADSQAVQFWQTLAEFEKTQHGGGVPLAFSFPKGSAMPVAEVGRAREGMMLSEAEVPGVQRRALQRAVLMMACRAVGAEEDPAKAQQAFAGESPSAPKDVFTIAMAKHLNELAQLYGPYKADRPDRLKLFNEKALAALSSLPESDDTKKLKEKIEKDLKAAEKR